MGILEVRIPNLTPAGTLTGTELLWLTQNGGSVKAQLDAITAFIGGSLGSWSFITSDYSAQIGERIAASTAGGAWVLTLPAGPAQGDVVEVQDAGGSFAANPLSVTSVADTIEGLVPPMSLTLNRLRVVFTFNGATWKVAGE